MVSGKILITGSTGIIGRALVEELAGQTGVQLRLQVRNVEKAKEMFKRLHTQSEIVECDFLRSSSEDISELSKDCQIVIHLAAQVHDPSASSEDVNALNVDVTEKLAYAAENNGINTFLFLSSSAVYGNGPFRSIEEDAPFRGESPYAVSKIASEKFLLKKQMKRLIILRPSIVFGEGDRGNMIKLIRAISKKRYVQIGAGRTLKSMIYSRDLARAVIACLERLSPGKHILNVANPDAISMKNLSHEIWYALGCPGQILSIPEPLIFVLAQLADKIVPGKLPVSEEQLRKLSTETTLNTNKLTMLTSFEPMYSIGAALRAEIKWAKNHDII